MVTAGIIKKALAVYRNNNNRKHDSIENLKTRKQKQGVRKKKDKEKGNIRKEGKKKIESQNGKHAPID